MGLILQTLRRKLQRNIEDYGAGTALRKGVEYLLSPLYQSRVYRIYRIELAGRGAAGPAPEGPIFFRILGPDEKGAIQQIENCAEWFQGKIEARLRKGDLCLAAFQGDRLAGFNLVAFEEIHIPLLKMHRTLRPTEAWSSQITVLKPYRRQGLASQMRLRLLEELRSRNIRKLYGGTLRSNEAALRLARSVGFVEFVDIHYSNILNFKRWRYKRVRRRGRIG